MLRLSLPITVYCCAMAALLGACMGSFLNCLTWRMLHGESVLRGRSHCDVCGHVLGVRDLVPVLSYVCSGGKCRYCGAKLSARHVWGELAGGAMFVSALLKYDISLQVLEAWLLACVLGICAGLASGRRDAPIPWGPSIATAAWVTLLTGDRVLQWYLSLFGM